MSFQEILKSFVVVMIFAPLAGCMTQRPSISDENFDLKKLNFVSLTPENWEVVYDGGGQVRFEDGNRISLRSGVPQANDTTYAALVILKTSESLPKNYIARLKVTTHEQLRPQNPNEWEVFWFLGNYRIAEAGKKEANYFVAKPSAGIELGTIFEEVGQKFLKTAPTPKLQLGQANEFIFVKRNHQFRVYKNQQLIMNYQGADLYQHAGTFGLYVEDAWATVESFSYSPL